MIDPDYFLEKLKEYKLNFYTGVPDSLLSSLCSAIENDLACINITAANEGNAIGIAAGFNLATKKIPVVYLQNSGIGNALNPLVSLVNDDVFKIPMLLIIGWRADGSVLDEPQHIKQGQITLPLLKLLQIEYLILDKNKNIDNLIKKSLDKIKISGLPVAIIVKQKTFIENVVKIKPNISVSSLKREAAINEILRLSDRNDIFISTTGKTSRELYELRKKRNEKNNDLLVIGSMGHASSIALGISIEKKGRRIICFDGDGSLIMHMGSLTTIGNVKPKNLIHIILNNGVHESVGGQPTTVNTLNLEKLSLACGYKLYKCAKSIKEITTCWKSLTKECGPIFLEIKISPGSRINLGRPEQTPIKNKKNFIKHCDSKIENN